MTITKTIQINVEADNAAKELEKVNKGVKEVDNTTAGLTGQLDKMTGGAVSGFSKLGGTIRTAITGFKSLKVAIAATGIGLLVIALGSLYTAFKSSEEGQNKFTKLMGQIGVVTGNVIDIISDLGEAVWAAGKALVKLATGDLKGASAAWGEFKDNVKEATTAIVNFGKETRKELAIAREIADMRAKATKLQRDLIVDTAKAERDVAELREKVTRKDLYNAQQRKGFLIEAQKINERLAAQQIEAARLNYEAIKAENQLSKSTIENKEAEAQAQAELIRLDTARLMKAKELGAELSAINQAEIAEKEALAKAQQKTLDDFYTANEKAVNDELEQFIKLQDTKIEILDLSNEKALAAEKKFADERIQLEESVVHAKYDAAIQTTQLISQILGEGSKLGKAFAIVSATISGIEGVQNAFTTAQKSPITALFPAYPFIQAGLAGAFSLAQIAKIKSTDESGKSLGGASGAGSGGARTGAPSFNLVKGTGTNQIADTLNQKNMTPLKAYVVTSDVSTGQSLDRKVIQGASLG